MPAVFHRTELAQQIARRLLDPPATSPIGSGLFLAAPRRTGKSTFLREDLLPALEADGAFVIYADLWEDRRADPADVIVGAVRAALSRREGALAGLARTAGLEGARIGGLDFSLDKVGLATGISLTRALEALSDDVRRLIVLIVDEAQHAIKSESGNDALFALKAARDALNGSEHHGLRIVATGSNRDKLAMLRNTKDQAFFGAPLVPFPPLGEDYVRWFVGHLPFADELDVATVTTWFRRAGSRPEILGAAVDTLLYDLEPSDLGPAERLRSLVDREIAAADEETMRVVRALTPLQSSVLREAAARGERFAPFEQGTLERYADTLRHIAPDGDLVPSTANVQQALLALQEKGLIWRAARGVYALEDAALADLMRREGLID